MTIDNNITLTDLIAIVSAIGTFLSSIFVLITLLELRTQRKHSYKPELVIPEICFDFNFYRERFIDTWKTDDGEYLKLKVYNVGMGVAQDIKFSWSYNKNSMLKIFEKIHNSEKGKFILDTKKDKLNYFKENELLAGCSLSSDNRELDFLLSSNNENNSYLLDLPDSYLCFSTMIYNNAELNKLFTLSNFKEGLEPLKLNITYKDIGGSVIKKTYNVNIEFFLRSLEGYSQNMRGRIYIKS